MTAKSAEQKRYAHSIFTSTVFWVLVIILLATILRIYRIDTESIWVDEAVTVRLARTVTLSTIQSTLGLDRQPPLYYFLLKAWLYISSTVFWIRLLSTISGIFTVYLVFLLGKRLVDTRTGLIGAFLLAISPYHIYYSQETRMYTLECFWFVLASYLFYHALMNNKKRYWVGYVIALEASLYTHYYTLFLILTHGCIVFYRTYHLRKKHISQKANLNQIDEPARATDSLFYRWSSSILAVFLGFIPLLPLFHNQLLSPSGGWVPIVQRLDLFKTIDWFMFGNYFKLGAFNVQPGHMFWVNLIKLFIIIGNMFVYVMLGFILWKRIKSNMVPSTPISFLSWHLFGLMILPWVLSFFIPKAFGISYYFGQRYQLVALPFFLILLAYGINLIPNRKLINAAIFVVIIFTSIPLYSLYIHPQKIPWNKAVELILQKQQKDDAVLLCRNYAVEVFEFYAPNQFNLIMPPGIYYRPESRNGVQELAKQIAGSNRVWWVTFDSPENPFEIWLSQHYQQTESYQYTRGVPFRVILYTKLNG